MKAMTIVLSVLLFMFTSLASVDANARHRQGPRGEGGPGTGCGFSRLFDKLDLTEDQQREVALILKKHREEIGKVAAAVNETRLAMKNAIHADEYSEDAVREAAQNAGNQREQMAVLMAQILVEVKSVLTPDQKALLLTMTEKRGKRSARFVDSKLSALDEWIAEHSE